MLLEVRVVASPFVLPRGIRTRIGLIVPRYRQTAVARNRLKRRLRELCRTRLLPVGIAADLVIRVRAEAYQASFAMLAADMDRVLVRLVSWRATAREPSAELDGSTGPTPE